MRVRTVHAPRRVFIGIKLSSELADAFIDMQSAFGEMPARFIPPEDIHLTLVPPFETRDLPYLRGSLRTALGKTPRFTLRFIRLAYGPDKERPRLAWVECGATKELISLKQKLLDTLGLKRREKVPFIPHMTVARFRASDREKLARRRIERPVRSSMEAGSVEIFESPRKGGSGYTVLASIPLQPKDGAPISHLS